jgi:hypothetical protein
MTHCRSAQFHVISHTMDVNRPHSIGIAGVWVLLYKITENEKVLQPLTHSLTSPLPVYIEKREAKGIIKIELHFNTENRSQSKIDDLEANNS